MMNKYNNIMYNYYNKKVNNLIVFKILNRKLPKINYKKDKLQLI